MGFSDEDIKKAQKTSDWLVKIYKEGELMESQMIREMSKRYKDRNKLEKSVTISKNVNEEK